MKHTLSVLSLLTVLSCCNANAGNHPTYPIIQMQNATNCHIKSDGSHYVGKGLPSIVSEVEPGLDWATIGDVGSWGEVPVLYNDVVLLGDKSGTGSMIEYTSGDKYIISDDQYSCYSIQSGVPGCYELSQTNPCV